MSGQNSKGNKAPATSPTEVLEVGSPLGMASGSSARRALPKSVIGIGASAGGLSALEGFFSNCPTNSGRAFVVVQHLSPQHESLMETLLSRRTTMPVKMLQEDCPLERDHVYLIPPGFMLHCERGMLRLTPRKALGLSLPIDLFFTTLARSYGKEAVAIVLSGTGSDGTRGVEAIAAAGGRVLVQDPAEAEFSGMPVSAITGGVASAVLPVARLALRALDMQETSDSSAHCPDPPEDDGGVAPTSLNDRDLINQILTQTFDLCGQDFRAYKQDMIRRRLFHRIRIAGLDSPADYLERLRSDPNEVSALQSELLISVTSFFRDPAVFEFLRTNVVEPGLARLLAGEVFRVWVAGCSTGEEAYSIGMLLAEALDREGKGRSFKIFATDAKSCALEVAGTGYYGAEQMEGMEEARLSRFFIPMAQGYCVHPELRQRIVFARHDLLRDPPFPNLDLVSCRNTLIYFRKELRAQAVARLKHGVKIGGHLLLGASESLAGQDNGFRAVDSKAKLYIRTARTDHELAAVIGADPRRPDNVRTPRRFAAKSAEALALTEEPERRVDRLLSLSRSLLAKQWLPPAIVFDARLQAVHFLGNLHPFIQPREGPATLELGALLREPLNTFALVLLRECLGNATAAQSEPLTISFENTTLRLRLHALPLLPSGTEPHVVLCFAILSDTSEQAAILPVEIGELARMQIDHLSQVLEETQLRLHSTIEALETSNEELQAANEELTAANEEMQSSNEELLSVNEEVNTVNAEYQEKLAELNQINADLDSMIKAVGIATIFVDEHLCIKRFSPDALDVFRLRDSDLGRPLADITNRLKHEGFIEDVERTMRSHRLVEREVTATNGRLYLVRILPYAVRPASKCGAVITLLDMSAYRDLTRLQKVIDALPQNVAVLDESGQIRLVNAAWLRFARANGDANFLRTGPGTNYLSVCRSCEGRGEDTDPDGTIAMAYTGLKAVLEGTLPSFSLDYPCHSPSEKRWFHMTAVAVSGPEFAAVVTHTEVTKWVTASCID